MDCIGGTRSLEALGLCDDSWSGCSKTISKSWLLRPRVIFCYLLLSEFWLSIFCWFGIAVVEREERKNESVKWKQLQLHSYVVSEVFFFMAVLQFFELNKLIGLQCLKNTAIHSLLKSTHFQKICNDKVWVQNDILYNIFRWYMNNKISPVPSANKNTVKNLLPGLTSSWRTASNLLKKFLRAPSAWNE